MIFFLYFPIFVEFPKSLLQFDIATLSLFPAPALVRITIISHLDYSHSLRGLSVSLLVLAAPSLHIAACVFFLKVVCLHICFKVSICSPLLLEWPFAMAGKADLRWPGCGHTGLRSVAQTHRAASRRAFIQVVSLCLKHSLYFPSISAGLISAHHPGLCLRGTFSGTPSLNNFFF